MKKILSDSDRKLLDKRIAEAEKQTGVQIVLASIVRSDSYVEIPWKAFAIGASLASLLMIIIHLFVLGWITSLMIFISLAAILVFGAIMALLSVWIPGFSRLFLSPQRKEAETLQYAQSLFLSHELFTTENRMGILLLVSQFERQVIILPDTGLRDQLTTEVLDEIISIMRRYLRRNELRKAMETGLDGIRVALGRSASGGKQKNELSDEIIEENGA